MAILRVHVPVPNTIQRQENYCWATIMNICTHSIRYQANVSTMFYCSSCVSTYFVYIWTVEQVFKGDQKSIFSARGCAWFSDDYVLGINYSLLYGWHSESGHKVLSLATAEFGHFTCVEPHPTTPILATSGAQINVWMPSSSKWPRLKGLTLADYHNHLNQMRMDWEDRHADD